MRDKQGLFAAARGGTFFLDEIGEMSPATQVKLLRVLQEREAIPVGGTGAIPVDVRVVAATNRDLEEDIKRGRFRTDLYYRLNVIAIHLPPLRDRREDVPIFVTEFLKKIAQEQGEPPKRLSPEALEAVMPVAATPEIVGGVVSAGGCCSSVVKVTSPETARFPAASLDSTRKWYRVPAARPDRVWE